MMSPLAASATLAVTASSARVSFGAQSNPSAALHLSNTGDNRVTVVVGDSSVTATLDAGITLPPNSQLLLDINGAQTHIAAISNASGNNLVVTPVALR